MPSKGFPSYTNSTITLTTGGSYTGDGINGWSGGSANAFTVKGRRTPFQRPEEDTTDTGNADAVGGPIMFRVDLEGFFKTGTIPPVLIVQEFVRVNVQVGFTLDAVVLVTLFEPDGTIGTALKYRFSGRTVGTFSYS
jgi:hypothetical protein